MNKAIEVILREFNTWEGCVMKEIRYTDDQKCEDRITIMETGNGISEELMAGTGIF